MFELQRRIQIIKRKSLLIHSQHAFTHTHSTWNMPQLHSLSACVSNRFLYMLWRHWKHTINHHSFSYTEHVFTFRIMSPLHSYMSVAANENKHAQYDSITSQLSYFHKFSKHLSPPFIIFSHVSKLVSSESAGALSLIFLI